MKRSGTIWLVVGVIAVAAALMYFVVMPQIRDGRTVEDIARKAEETVQEVKKAVNDAGKEVEEVAVGVEEAKARMARIGKDAKTAAGELKTLLDTGAATPEQIAAAKAKLAAALRAAAEIRLPAEVDAATSEALARASEGAKSAVATLEALPADPAAAKAALADLQNGVLAVLPGTADPQPAATTEAQPADAKAVEPANKAETPAETPAETASDIAKASTPAFDILRVEKDGSTVIAGRAEPGAKVEIVNGDTVIASTQADTTGDFAAVLDDPLTSGDHSLTLKATTKDGKSSVSEEVATVSVPANATGELLAMVTKPGEASKIITMPETAADATADAASDKSVTPDAAASATATKDAAAPADAAATVPDLPAAASELASTPPVVTGDADTSGAQQTAAAETAVADPAAATPAEAIDQAEQTPPAAAPEVMVSAVELEGDRIFIAGNARPGATVRVYADDQIVAEAKADETGRFVADGTIRLAVGNHTIRADVLSADGKKVEFRASVPFFRPEGDLAAVASNDAAADAPAIEPLANGTFDKARDEARKSVELLKGLYADGRTPTVEELAAARSSAEIALKSLADVHVPADVDPALAEMAATASREAGKALDRLKAVPADVAAFQSALGEVETIVGAAVKPAAKVANADDAPKTAQAEPAIVSDDTVDKPGDPVSADDVQVTAKVERLEKSATIAEGAQATVETPAAGESQPNDQAAASADQPKVIEQAPLKQSEGSVIIRRGDTLWQISRRVYGKGVRYTTIYVANKGQINDPDRIMPGQIFSMPGKWLDNAEQLHKERMQHDQ